MELDEAAQQEKVGDFLKSAVEKLKPAVTEAVKRDASGHFEVHYAHGKFQRVIRKDTL